MNEPEFPLYDHDDDLIEATRGDRGPRVRIERPQRILVVLGRGSKAALEIDLAACRADDVPVLRRRGGGCSVVLDPGNALVSVTLPVRGIAGSRCHAERLTRWVAEGLRRSGFDGIRKDGISDLVVDVADVRAPGVGGDETARETRKVAGSCVYRARDVLYYSASILVAPRLDLMERYLRHPPREPEYRRGRAHSEFVTGLTRISPSGTLTAEDVVTLLRGSLVLAHLAEFPPCA